MKYVYVITTRIGYETPVMGTLAYTDGGKACRALLADSDATRDILTEQGVPNRCDVNASISERSHYQVQIVNGPELIWSGTVTQLAVTS